jgi:hypothetical protein
LAGCVVGDHERGVGEPGGGLEGVAGDYRGGVWNEARLGRADARLATELDGGGAGADLAAGGRRVGELAGDVGVGGRAGEAGGGLELGGELSADPGHEVLDGVDGGELEGEHEQGQGEQTRGELAPVGAHPGRAHQL